MATARAATSVVALVVLDLSLQAVSAVAEIVVTASERASVEDEKRRMMESSIDCVVERRTRDVIVSIGCDRNVTAAILRVLWTCRWTVRIARH